MASCRDLFRQPIGPTLGPSSPKVGPVDDSPCQRGLGAAAPLQQPVREQRALTHLWDRDIQRPNSGVQLAVPVVVAAVDPLHVKGAVLGDATGSPAPRAARWRMRRACGASDPGWAEPAPHAGIERVRRHEGAQCADVAVSSRRKDSLGSAEDLDVDVISSPVTAGRARGSHSRIAEPHRRR